MGLLSGITGDGSGLGGACFQPPLGLRNGHIQSILACTDWRQRLAERFSRQLRESAREVILDCGEGVRLQGFYSPASPGAAAQRSAGPRGLVVLLHGWEGSANSGYLLMTGQHLIDLGYDVFRLHYRDHGDTHHLNRGVFHSCRIGEVVGAVGSVRDLYTPERLMVAGFSLGGNFALRVGLRAPEAGIEVAQLVAVNPVIDPRSTMEAFEAGWSFYERHFLKKWRLSLERKQAAFPDLYDFSPCTKMNTLRDVTSFMVEHCTRFGGLYEYLDGYSVAGDRLASMTVPTTIITAEDDPLIPIGDFKGLALPTSIELEAVPYGGHCGFLEGYNLESWLESRIAAHLTS
jgi:predicted alpha/beta-fold hydrolase